MAHEGLHALTMRRIAAEAGTSRAIVSTYFRDMRDLVLGLEVVLPDGERLDLLRAFNRQW